MSAVQQMLIGAGGGATDPYYANVSLLLHMDGSNGSTTFTDNSPSPKTVTSNGNTLAEVSTSVVKYGTGSCNFKSSNNYLRANAIASEFDFGAGDFTVEFWVNWSAVDDSGFVSGNEIGSFDFAYVSGTLRVGRINTAWDTTVTWITPTAGVWYYIAYSRSGSDLRIFVNGTQVTPTSSNSTNYAASLVNVGLSRTVSDARPFKGYMDDLRITKGVARYTANFTPPAAAFPNS